MIINMHSKNLAYIVRDFAEYLECSDSMTSVLCVGAIFHDVGKLYLPQEILSLPRELNEKEFAIAKKHAQIGYEIVGYITDNDVISNICLSHHEKWDGSGYPRGLKGLQIPQEARIIALCDVYEALTSKRFYKDAMDPGKALKIIKLNLGRHFDPVIGEKFIEFIRSREKI